MALWFTMEDGREVHKPPYTKAEQIAIYKTMADGPKVMMKHSAAKPTSSNVDTLDTGDTTENLTTSRQEALAQIDQTLQKMAAKYGQPPLLTPTEQDQLDTEIRYARKKRTNLVK